MELGKKTSFLYNKDEEGEPPPHTDDSKRRNPTSHPIYSALRYTPGEPPPPPYLLVPPPPPYLRS